MKKSSLTKVCLLAKPVLKPDILFIAYYDIPARYTFRLITPFEYTTESQTKNRAVKITQRTLVPGVCTLWVRSAQPSGEHRSDK